MKPIRIVGLVIGNCIEPSNSRTCALKTNENIRPIYRSIGRFWNGSRTRGFYALCCGQVVEGSCFVKMDECWTNLGRKRRTSSSSSSSSSSYRDPDCMAVACKSFCHFHCSYVDACLWKSQLISLLCSTEGGNCRPIISLDCCSRKAVGKMWVVRWDGELSFSRGSGRREMWLFQWISL